MTMSMNMNNITTTKISNKFIPRTHSHTKSRIKNIVNKLKHKKITKKSSKKSAKKTSITNTNFKTTDFNVYKKNYYNKLLLNKSQEHTTINTSKKQTHDNSNTNSNTNYIIVIPSYNRPELIQTKTLSLLQKHNIDSSIITIFVSDKEQYDLYKEKIPSSFYNKLIIGVKGLKNQRNFINNYYPEGVQIVQMDDDIDKIVQLVSRKRSRNRSKRQSKTKSKSITKRKTSTYKTLKPIENLDTFIKEAFAKCKANGIFLWGIYPLANAYFMTDTRTTNLRFIVGPMFGMINRHRPDLQLTVDEKENSERTLQHWVIDGKVLRFNNIGLETKYYKNKGGMQDEGKDRKEEALKSIIYLHNKYPSITKLYLGKKSGVPEIKFCQNLTKR